MWSMWKIVLTSGDSASPREGALQSLRTSVRAHTSIGFLSENTCLLSRNENPFSVPVSSVKRVEASCQSRKLIGTASD